MRSCSGLTSCVVLSKHLPLSGVQTPTCQMQALASVRSSTNAPYCGLTPWAGAWLRHGKQCTGHRSRILCLPTALSLGPSQVICRQQPRAKQVKTSARPPSTVQPTLQTPTMLQSLSTGPTMAPPKVVCPAGQPRPEPCHLHQGHKGQDSHLLLHMIIHLLIRQTCIEDQPWALGKHWGANQTMSLALWRRHGS